MRNKFDKQLSKLNEELIHMGSMMEQSIEMAISALVKQDREKAEKTMLYADEIERKEKEIENMCFQILLSQQPVAGDLRRVSSQMAKETTVMVINSIDAYVRGDIVLAGEVIKSDDIVDNLFNTVKTELIRLIHDKPENGEQAADLLMIAKYFERIGDHAVNIAEWVIFAITGNTYSEK